MDTKEENLTNITKDFSDIDNNTTHSKSELNSDKITNNDIEKLYGSNKEIKNIGLDRLEYFDIFKCGMKIRYNSNKFINSIQNKLDIQTSHTKEAKMIGNGNCFYKCLSKFLYCKTEYDEKLRDGVLRFCKDNNIKISNYLNQVKTQNDELINTVDYINNVNKNNDWSEDIELTICSFVFEMNIAIYKYTEDRKKLQFIKSYIFEENNINNPTMIVINDKTNHYNMIYPYTTTSTGIDEQNQTFIDHDELNPYPKYLGKDKNLYYNIFNFLNDGIVNGKRTWPYYIQYIQDKKFRDKKKSEFYKKIGITNECNMDHTLDFKKKFFKLEKPDLIASQDKYIVENNRLYLTRYEYNNTTEKKLIFKKYQIPYKTEIKDVLYKSHDEKNHPGKEETIEQIKNNNYYWISMSTDVDEYLNNCSLCYNKVVEKSEQELEQEKEKEKRKLEEYDDDNDNDDD